MLFMLQHVERACDTPHAKARTTYLFIVYGGAEWLMSDCPRRRADQQAGGDIACYPPPVKLSGRKKFSWSMTSGIPPGHTRVAASKWWSFVMAKGRAQQREIPAARMAMVPDSLSSKPATRWNRSGGTPSACSAMEYRSRWGFSRISLESRGVCGAS